MTADKPLDPRIERTRRVVVDAAVELLAADGVAQVTIDGIAERSGVARSTIYRHWPDRADLFAEAFGIVCAVTDVVEVGSFLAELRQRASELAHGLSHEAWGRMLPSVVGSADHDPDLRSALDAFTAQRRHEATAVVERAIGRGELDPSIEVEATLERFVAPFFFRRLMTGQPLDDAFVEAQLHWVCDELGAPYSPPD